MRQHFTHFQQFVLQQAALRADDLRICDSVLKLAQDNKIVPLVEVTPSIQYQDPYDHPLNP